MDNLFNDANFIAQLDAIESDRDDAQAWMKMLQNPPQEFLNAYEDAKNLYNSYMRLTDLALSPSGSLNTYTNSYSEIDAEFIGYYNIMELYFD